MLNAYECHCFIYALPTSISELVQSNDYCIADFRHCHFLLEIICRRQGR
nr:MAG TPA: hypothetical protein [Caudoviricetes sp.]